MRSAVRSQSGFNPSFVVAVFLVLATLSVLLSGCGGGGSSPSVAITATSATVDGTDSTTLTATVTNDKNSAGVTWSVSGGGTLSNTSTTSATYTAPAAGSTALTVTVTATSIASTSQTSTVTITVPALPTISTSSLTAATVGTAYSLSLSATGGISPYTWSLQSGTLPACLTLSTSGAITGTPNAACAGTYSGLVFHVKDSGSPNSLTAMTSALTLVINPAATIVLPSTALSAGTYEVSYSASVAATGGAGSLTYAATGSLPGGLTLNTSTGAITGMPNATGTFPFSITASDSYGDSVSHNYSITVSYAAMSVTTTSLPNAVTNANYSSSLSASGGTNTPANYSWSLANGTSLPSGLSLSSSGAITGQANGSTGTTNFTVKVTDTVANLSTTAALSITVTNALTVTTTSLPNGSTTASYSQTLSASGGSGMGYTWALYNGTSLPAGLSLSSAGAITGSPTSAGTTNFTVQVTDSASNTATAQLSITVASPLTITSTSLPSATTTSAYSQTIGVSGGVSPYTYTVSSGSLPSWASLNSSTGKITGTPNSSQTGSTTFTIQVEDSASTKVTQQYTLSVYAVAGTNDSYLSGHYAFYAVGWVDGTNIGSTYRAAIAGSFLADGNGNITSGVLDYNDGVGGLATDQSITGTYALPANNLGQMSLTLPGGKTITIALAAGGITSGVSTEGDIIRFDDATGIGTAGGVRFSGQFAQQTLSQFTTANLTGGYAFGLTGETCPLGTTNCNNAPTPGPLAVAGAMTLSGSGSISAGTEDIGLSDGNCTSSCTTLYSQAAFTGSYGTPNATTGRTTFTIAPSSALPSADQTIWPSDYIVYMVNSTTFYLISTDTHVNYVLLAGTATQQSTTTFSTSSLSGNAVFWVVQQNDSPGWGGSSAVSDSDALTGQLSFSSGAISINIESNNQGTMTTQTGTGTYTVSTGGRVTIAGVGNNTPIFYLSGTNTGYGIETGGAPGVFAVAPQSATTVGSGTYIFGNLDMSQDNGETAGTGTVGSGSYSLTSASTDSDGSITFNGSVSGTYTVGSGGLITFSDGAYGFVVSPTELIHLDPPSGGNSAPSLSVVHQ